MEEFKLMKKVIRLLGLLMLGFASPSFSADKLEKVSLLLDWKFQYEFAGFIMAKEKGFYREQGLDVEIIEYEEDSDIVESVLSQEHHYGTYNSSLSVKDGKLQPTILMATYFQQSPLALVTAKDIKRPKDIIGRTIMLSNQQRKYSALALLLDHFYINDKNTKMVPHSFNIDAFVSQDVDVMSVFKTNELYELDKRGVEYNIIDPSDYGFATSAVNLFSSFTEVSNHPERAQKFVSASNQGWAYAVAHTEETIRLIHQHYAPQKSLEELRFEAKISQQMMLLDFFQVGEVNADLSQRMLKQLKFSHLINENETLGSFLLDDVLNDASKNTGFSPQQKDYLYRKKEIKMCVDPDWMPFEKIKAGAHIGIVNDVINGFRKQLPIPIKLVPTRHWQESLLFAKSRRCDMFSLAAATPNRSVYMDFTQPYLSSHIVLATKMDTPFIGDIKEVRQRKMGVVKGYAIAEQLERQVPGINLVEVSSMQEGLARVDSGELFGYIGNLMGVANAIQHDFTGALKVSARLQGHLQLGIATRNDEPLLNEVFNKLISNIDEAKLQGIYNKWVAVKHDSFIDYSLVWKLIAVLLFIALAYLLHYLKLSKLNQLLLMQSTTDKLTGLYNRAKADLILAQNKYDVDRYKTKVSIVLLDIDYFKRVNDNHGHIIGDDVLLEFAQVLQNNVRVNDFVCRWGGEEFMIICPNIQLEEAHELANKLLTKIRSHHFQHIDRMTASAGISQFSRQSSIQVSLQHADAALYRAKNSGRDQTVVYRNDEA